MTNDEVDRLEPTRKFVKAITNKTRFSILLLITANREATLDQISEFVNKSKSTVHHHIQQLLFSGFIREITKPGSKTRYYQRIDVGINEKMSETFNYEKFLKESPETQEEIKNLFAELSRTNFIMMTNALEFLS
ncbi:MAG: winged helix-turn-helix transcriptional regulator, partial [Candidatus Heimdallarchaeota archaeon]